MPDRNSLNLIDGTTPDARNVTVGGGGDGVFLMNASGDNVVQGNALLGIDLGEADGVTPNDPGGPDTGPNGMQNFPVLTSVQSSPSGVVTVAGTLDSTPASSFRVEFFSSGSCDASGHGEGRRYLGFTDVITDGSGAATGELLSASSLDIASDQPAPQSGLRAGEGFEPPLRSSRSLRVSGTGAGDWARSSTASREGDFKLRSVVSSEVYGHPDGHLS